MAALLWQHYHDIYMMASPDPHAPFIQLLFVPALSEPYIFWAQYQTQQFTVTSSGPRMDPILALLYSAVPNINTLLYLIVYNYVLGSAVPIMIVFCTVLDSDQGILIEILTGKA